MTRAETDERLQFQFGQGTPDPEFQAHIHELWNRPGQMRALYGVLSRFDTFAELDSAEKPANFPPVMLLWGAENKVLPPQGAQDMAARLRPDRMEMLEGCGHLAMRERPDLVNPKIDGFLEQTAEAPAHA
jgi:pimeloyl-ACP methyl ester carboxylesterase